MTEHKKKYKIYEYINIYIKYTVFMLYHEGL